MSIDAMKAVLDFLEQGNFVYPTKIADDLRAAITEAEKCEPENFRERLMENARLSNELGYVIPQPAIPDGMVLVKLFDLENAIESYEGGDGQSCLRILRNIIAAAPKPEK